MVRQLPRESDDRQIVPPGSIGSALLLRDHRHGAPRCDAVPEGGEQRLRLRSVEAQKVDRLLHLGVGVGAVGEHLGQRVDEQIDLVALENGGRAIACSNEHYGSMHNLNVAGRGVNMGDGWETARRRGPGNDWVILALGHVGVIESVEIDTAHFKGNYPDRVSLQAALFDADVSVDSKQWQSLLPDTKLEMDRQHEFKSELEDIGAVSHVRMAIYPDGGVSRLRLYGRPFREE